VTSREWTQLLFAMALIAAMFIFPIVTIWLDERRKRRVETQAFEDSSPEQN
jgi:hypothetical protein